MDKEEMQWACFLAMSLERRAWLVGSRNHTEDLLGIYGLFPKQTGERGATPCMSILANHRISSN